MSALGGSVAFKLLRGFTLDLSKVSALVDERFEELALGRIQSLDVLTAVFYRDGGAYVIGRLSAEDKVVPLVFCLRNRENGIELDAVLLDEDSVSILFSFAHSYFFVNARHHRKMIEFLSTIMPLKVLMSSTLPLGIISMRRRSCIAI